MLINILLWIILLVGVLIFITTLSIVYDSYKMVKEFTLMKLDWFKVFRFFVYSIILMAGSLYLL